jgi:MFS family permease
MDAARKNVVVLAVCQGLLLNNSVLITINALAGYALAPDKALATLPVTAYFVGSALTTLPLSLLMKRIGRRAGFTVGAAAGMLGSLLCAWGVYTGSFWLLCLGTLVLGAYFAAGQYYRFAASSGRRRASSPRTSWPGIPTPGRIFRWSLLRSSRPRSCAGWTFRRSPIPSARPQGDRSP